MSALDKVVSTYTVALPPFSRAVALQNEAVSELSQLRAELAQAQARIAELTREETTCPLCTWRGPVELVCGVCPQCDVDWPKSYREFRDSLTVARERIAAQDEQLAQARRIMQQTVYGHPNRSIDGSPVCGCDYCMSKRSWLTDHPAPERDEVTG